MKLIESLQGNAPVLPCSAKLRRPEEVLQFAWQQHLSVSQDLIASN